MTPGPTLPRRLARLALVATLAAAVGTVCGLGAMASARYVQTLTHPGCWHVGRGPQQAGITGAQDVSVPAHDGPDLAAWYVPPSNGALIILLGGLGSGRDGMLREGAVLAAKGYGLLMLDQRACSLPSGLSTLGYLEARDLRQAVAWAAQQPGVGHIGALGFSAGGVTAILAAAEDQRIEALVAEGGFADLEADLSGEYQRGGLVARIVFLLNPVFFRLETGVNPALVSPVSALGSVSPRPLLLIYGDREVDSARAWQQLDAAGDPKELWVVADCGHGGYLDAAPQEWETRVVGFFDAAFGL